MTRKPPERTTNRRDFLRDLAMAGGVATLAGAGGAAVARPVAKDPTGTREREGYHVTAHVAKYYEKARI
jgi:nitrous oxide reductase